MRVALRVFWILLLALQPAAAKKYEQIKRINPPALWKPEEGSFTHVVRAGKLLFISGQTPIRSGGQLSASTMRGQAEQVFTNLLSALYSQGADISRVTKLTTYVTSISEYRDTEVT